MARRDVQVLELAGRELPISTPGKVLFAERGETKLDLVRYYAAIAEPRQIAMYLCRNILEMTYPEIGQSFGNRHHTTVIHACDKVAKDVSTNSELSRIIDDLTKRVRQQ